MGGALESNLRTMSASDPPTLATGKICYIEIPANDIDRSAEFYGQAFGWRIRRRGDGATAFDDTVNEVSGTWVLDRPPLSQPGLMIYIMVADADAAAAAVLAAGGEIVQPIDPRAQEKVARFRDPAGNVLGIYEQPGLTETNMADGQADTPSVDPIPEHLHTVTPRLVVGGAADAIEFYRRAFGADEVGERFTGPDGKLIHAELRIGDSIVMITDAEDDAEARSPGTSVSAIMATYWENVDTVWERAVQAGAEVIHPLADQFYGERGGRLGDPYGQQWMLSQRIEDLSHDEITSRAAQ
jgi:PhnB protein